MKKELNKKVSNYILTCIIVSSLFIIGIPMIPIGFVNNMLWLGIPGIIFTAVGFYATPIMWTQLPRIKFNTAILLAVYEDDILSIAELAANFRKSERYMRNKIVYYLRSRKLEGYKLNSESNTLVKLTKKQGSKEKEITKKNRCEACGAPLVKGADTCTHCNMLVK